MLDFADCVCGPRSASRRRRSIVALLVLAVAIQYLFVIRAAVQAGRFRLIDCVVSVKGGKPSGSTRDCQHGEAPYCTQEQPCTPCSAGGCTACTASNTGLCQFVEGIGPYCRFNDGVRACTKCCS